MQELLSAVVARVAPLRRAKACDPFSECVVCRTDCLCFETVPESHTHLADCHCPFTGCVCC